MKGRVIESTGSWYKVRVESTIYEARLPGKFRLTHSGNTNPVAVGDFVTIELEQHEHARITSIEERQSVIKRQATHGKRGDHVLAANIDQAIVVQSIAEPEYKTGFIDRFLVACESFHIEPMIAFNKSDLLSDAQRDTFAATCHLYEELGYRTFTFSCEDEVGLDLFARELENKVNVIIGPSGVGKTTILNALLTNQKFKTGEISQFSKKGKHTTTFARLVPLPFGGYYLDTPGIREFGITSLEAHEIDLCFIEFKPYRSECKFYNCSHLHEPICAIRSAVEAGELAKSRYDSYRSIFEELSDKEN